MPPHKRRSGLTRLTRYLAGRWSRVALLSLVGICSAAAPVAALLVVQDAINNGMEGHDSRTLSRDVIANTNRDFVFSGGQSTRVDQPS